MSLELYTTTSRTGVSMVEFDYLGGPKQSLGGIPSQHQMLQVMSPLPLESGTPAYSLFPDVTSSQRVSGYVSYRGIMVKNASSLDLPTLRLKVAQPQSSALIAINAFVADAMPRLNNETVDPGVVFSTDVTVGPIPAGHYVALWVRRTIPAACQAWSRDYWGLEVTPGTGSTLGVVFFQNLLANVGITKVSGAITPKAVKVGATETFTIVCSDLFGAPTDPAQNRVRVIVSRPSDPDPSGNFPEAYSELDTATRVGVGVYSYPFSPASPGFYTIRFDIGEDASTLGRNVYP